MIKVPRGIKGKRNPKVDEDLSVKCQFNKDYFTFMSQCFQNFEDFVNHADKFPFKGNSPYTGRAHSWKRIGRALQCILEEWKNTGASLDGLEIIAAKFLHGKKKMIENTHVKYLIVKSPQSLKTEGRKMQLRDMRFLSKNCSFILKKKENYSRNSPIRQQETAM